MNDTEDMSYSARMEEMAGNITHCPEIMSEILIHLWPSHQYIFLFSRTTHAVAARFMPQEVRVKVGTSRENVVSSVVPLNEQREPVMKLIWNPFDKLWYTGSFQLLTTAVGEEFRREWDASDITCSWTGLEPIDTKERALSIGRWRGKPLPGPIPHDEMLDEEDHTAWADSPGDFVQWYEPRSGLWFGPLAYSDPDRATLRDKQDLNNAIEGFFHTPSVRCLDIVTFRTWDTPMEPGMLTRLLRVLPSLTNSAIVLPKRPGALVHSASILQSHQDKLQILAIHAQTSTSSLDTVFGKKFRNLVFLQIMAPDNTKSPANDVEQWAARSLKEVNFILPPEDRDLYDASLFASWISERIPSWCIISFQPPLWHGVPSDSSPLGRWLKKFCKARFQLLMNRQSSRRGWEQLSRTSSEI